MRATGRTAATRRGMIALSILLGVAQVADIVWPRTDGRTGSPAGLIFVAALSLLLACYPTGRAVPRWIGGVAVLLVAMFAANLIVGPDISARVFWPLPAAPLLLLLAIGGQGYRYWRRSTAAEREAARWPVLGVLLTLTLFLPADLIALLLTGRTIGEPPPALAALQQLVFLLPAVGFLCGLLAPLTGLVDRLLAIWVAFVVAGASLGAIFGGAYALASRWLDPPWAALVAAALAVVAGIWVTRLAARFGRRLVFRGREDEHRAVHELTRRLQDAIDPVEIPNQVVDAVRSAVGNEAVLLSRFGHTDAWAVAGEPIPHATGTVEHTVRHLGVPVAVITVWPRPAESALASADLRLIDALASAAAPALHSARLAGAFPELTDRERQVLAGITRGLPNSAIAARLGVSDKTVANYVSIVLTKLRVPDKERAAELARRRNAVAEG